MLVTFETAGNCYYPTLILPVHICNLEGMFITFLWRKLRLEILIYIIIGPSFLYSKNREDLYYFLMIIFLDFIKLKLWPITNV